MFRFKSIALFAALVFGFGYENCCQADGVDCLQFPVYYDDEGNYLFLMDEYLDPSNCANSFDGEYFWWVSTEPPYTCPRFPEACPDCLIRFSGNASFADADKRKSEVKTVGAQTMKVATDGPFPILLTKDYVFGKDKAKADLPKTTLANGKVLNPSAGITLISSSWVQVVPKTPGAKPIDVKLFSAVLDYERAGVTFPEDFTKPKTRIIRVGFEMAGADATNSKSYTPYQQSTKRPKNFSGNIDVNVDGDKFTYHVVTKTPLFK